MNIGIIMDGNRRYAKKHLLSSLSGHQNGFKNLLKIASLAPKYNIQTLTVYALSTENMKSRSEEEISNICLILKKGLEQYTTKLNEDNVKVQFLGNLSVFTQDLQELMTVMETQTINNSLLTLQICLNYGGRDDIVYAVNKLLGRSNVTEQDILEHLYSPIEPDLIIRTGGDVRLSNFLTWQSTYSELYFTDKLWPEFDEEELAKAIEQYNSKDRRYGK
jgi:undecaprenyl diphosphate synthase